VIRFFNRLARNWKRRMSIPHDKRHQAIGAQSRKILDSWVSKVGLIELLEQIDAFDRNSLDLRRRSAGASLALYGRHSTFLRIGRL
jgi:hypothetical protein